MMALLDMQGMDPASRSGNRGGGGSVLSVLLCDSMLSTTLCL
jgi:hypothetical protein